jgi:hypothetical protein
MARMIASETFLPNRKRTGQVILENGLGERKETGSHAIDFLQAMEHHRNCENHSLAARISSMCRSPHESLIVSNPFMARPLAVSGERISMESVFHLEPKAVIIFEIEKSAIPSHSNKNERKQT